jgi:hypothetical protein
VPDERGCWQAATVRIGGSSLLTVTARRETQPKCFLRVPREHLDAFDRVVREDAADSTERSRSR